MENAHLNISQNEYKLEAENAPITKDLPRALSNIAYNICRRHSQCGVCEENNRKL